MDINYWYLAILVLSLVYIIPVLLIRGGLNRRKDSRRMGERRVSMVMVQVDRRTPFTNRRHGSRRA
ncbi:MAG: hypothetical protein COA44_10505 [Arcobacter sp.]|nr:MAG: hypothetical protein COA44_10505 [Arcobacter sp.]